MPFALKLRIVVVAVLGLAPVLAAAGVGYYHLWHRGWAFYAWGGTAVCFATAYGLAWYWTRRGSLAAVLPPTGAESAPGYWTDRDREAWKLVEAHAAAADKLTPDQMQDADRYSAEAQKLALQIAQLYAPGTAHPFGHLTLPEILTCGELVAHDLAELVEKYIPGSHMLVVNDWARAGKTLDQATTWYPRLRNAYWALSAVIDPIHTGMQVLGTKAGLAPMFQRAQQNVMVWFHTAYVHKLGRYLIELNSGRLKVGAKRYLELMAQHVEPVADVGWVESSRPAETPGEEDGGSRSSTRPKEAPPVTLAVVGPVKAGKSSLVNAMLGEQLAATDVLPLTPGATKYTLREPGQPLFTLVDTAGYGNDGPTDADLAAALEAASHADLLILATPANSAARRPEVEFLGKLKAAFAARPHLRMPPTLLALTKADLLSPKAEWSPPYDWKAGTRPKEATMRDAVAAAREQFGALAGEAVPVCGSPGREWGVRDDLLATVAGQLGEARGVGLLRALHAEAAADKWKRAGGQLLNAGKALFGAWLESNLKK
jgi:predicted GTPase